MIWLIIMIIGISVLIVLGIINKHLLSGILIFLLLGAVSFIGNLKSLQYLKSIDTNVDVNTYIVLNATKIDSSDIAENDNTFFIPWDKKEIYYVDFLHYENLAISFIPVSKIYIYVPQNDYIQLLDRLNIPQENRLDKDPMRFKDYLIKNNIHTENENSFDTSKVTDMSDLFNNTQSITEIPVENKTEITTTQEFSLIRSIPVFKYELIDGNYIIRCEDGEFLIISQDIISIKKSDSNVEYLDKIEVITSTTDNEEPIKTYKYELYLLD